jgi:monoamine oxidase
VTFNKGYTLTRVERREPERSLALHFKTRDGKDEFRETRRVILALPRRALQLIKMDHDVVNSESFRDDLDAVLPVPACKLYLVFDRPWWTKSRIGRSFFKEDKVFASYTDLPMRQCYYFRDDNSDQEALVMACYADYVATSFWSVLAETTDHEISSQNWLANANLPRGSAAMVRAARQQLSAMHGGIVVPDTKWLPNYCDWAIDPFGAAWHAWAPHIKSWEVRKRMRQPNTSVPLYTCGEAFAQFQGWVEGAINSAEMALRHASQARIASFRLDKPRWGGLGEEPEF